MCHLNVPDTSQSIRRDVLALPKRPRESSPLVGHHFFGEHHRDLIRFVPQHQIDKIEQILPTFGSNQTCRIRIGERFGSMIVTQERSASSMSPLSQQVMSQKLYGMIELILRACASPFLKAKQDQASRDYSNLLRIRNQRLQTNPNRFSLAQQTANQFACRGCRNHLPSLPTSKQTWRNHSSCNALIQRIVSEHARIVHCANDRPHESSSTICMALRRKSSLQATCVMIFSACSPVMGSALQATASMYTRTV